MSDIFKMFNGGMWKFVVSWLLPCVVFVAVSGVTLYPPFKTFGFVAHLDKSVTASDTLGVLVFTATAFVLAAVMALDYMPTYRTLEGYSWPRRLFLWGRKAQVTRRNRLAKKINQQRREEKAALQDDPRSHVAGYHSTQVARLRERLALYPDLDKDYLPTRLGNAMRAAERYGVNTYGLDTQVLWYELGTVTPESLQEDMQSARGMVDFFVGIVVLAGVYAATATGLAFWQLDWRYGVGAMAAVAIARVAYLRAVSNALEIAMAQQAIVNLSRGKLAELFGLTLPPSIEDERRMWKSLTTFVRKGRAADAMALEEWRKAPGGDCGGQKAPAAPAEDRGAGTAEGQAFSHLEPAEPGQAAPPGTGTAA
jgi:hypothetical protein